MRSNRISKFGKFIVVIMTLVMILGMLPNLAFAETESNLGKVRVIVENTTFLEETAAWTGTLVDTFVDLTDDSTVMSCVVDALDTVNATQKGAESNYISEINGLAAFDGGGESGWMGTLNDWFTSEGFGAFTVQNGKLTADDEIRIMYTTNGYGEDLGGSWNNSDKTVKDVSFSVGTLNTTFDKDTHTYTLTLPEKTTEVKVTPTASNRNYQVKTYLGTQAEGTEYKRTVNVPVKTGDVITVVCGDKSWPTMNNNTGDAQTYTFNVVVESDSKLETLAFCASQSVTGDSYKMTPAFSPTVKDYTVLVPATLSDFFYYFEYPETGYDDASTIAVFNNTSTSNKDEQALTADYGYRIENFLPESGSASLQLKVYKDFKNDPLSYTTYNFTVKRNNVLRPWNTFTITNPEDSTTLNVKESIDTARRYDYTVDLEKKITTVNIKAYESYIGGDVEVVGADSNGDVTLNWVNKKAVVTIKVTKEGYEPGVYTITFNDLSPAGVSSLFIDTFPDKTEYALGDKFDSTGMVIKANMDDGTTKTIPLSDLVITPTGAITLDNYTKVQASYQTISVKIPITLKRHEFKGSGTKEDPYLLENADDLTALSKEVNGGDTFAGKYFKITNNITLPTDWTPIGTLKEGVTYSPTVRATSYYTFNGNIDGKKSETENYLITVPSGGKTLIGCPKGANFSNIDIYGEKINGYGFVEYYCNGSTCTIDNVNIRENSHIKMSGLLGGYASGSNAVVITNCTIGKGVVIGDDGTWEGLSESYSYPYGPSGTIQYNDMVGSFAGAFNGTIRNCVSYATVYGRNYVGGIAGMKGQSMGDFIIENCVFDGKVVATGEYVGGIAGSGYTATSAPNTPGMTIQNCLVTGSVEGLDKVGGITGGNATTKQMWNNGIGYIRANLVTGTVSATKSDATIGGIIGYINAVDKYNIIDNNYFLETIASKGIGGVGSIEESHEQYKVDETARYNQPIAIKSAELTNGSLIAKLNSAGVGNNVWKQGEKTPVHTNEKRIYRLQSSGLNSMSPKTFKSSKGFDTYNSTTYKVTAYYTDGTTSTFTPVEAAINGPDFTKAGYQLCSLTYEGYELFYGIKVNNDGECTDSTLTNVQLGIYGDTIHTVDKDNVHTLADGNLTKWVENAVILVEDEDTAFDVLTKAAKAYGFTFVSEDTEYGKYVSSITYNGVTLSSESNKMADGKSYSGWQFTVNGESVLTSLDKTKLKANDKVLFYFEDDYSLVYVDSAINAIKAIPSTLTKDNKVKLTDAENSLLYLSPIALDKVKADENYKKLTDAQAKLANAKAFDTLADKVPASVTLADKANVKAANDKLQTLTEEEKGLAADGNVAKVEAANKRIAALEAAKAFDDAVNALPEVANVKISDKDKVVAARTIYTGLDDDAKALVIAANVTKLSSLEQRISDLEKAKEVDDMINALPSTTEVKVSDKEAVAKAKAKYDTLTPAQKQLLTSGNADKLAALEKIVGDKEKAKAVDDMINAIDMNSSDRAVKVAQARSSYDNLTTDQKGYVENLAKLQGYEKQITDEEKANAVKELIKKLPETSNVKVKDENSIKEAQNAFNNLTDDQKKLISDSEKTKLEDNVNAIAVKLKKVNDAKKLIEALPRDIVEDDDLWQLLEADTLYKELTADEKEALGNDNVKRIESAKTQAAALNHNSGNVSISGVDWNVRIVAVPLAEGDDYDRIKNGIDNKTLISLYDVYVEVFTANDDNSVDLDAYLANAKLTFKESALSSYKDIVVYRDYAFLARAILNSLEEIDCEVSGNNVIVKYSEDGLYVIAGNYNTPKTGDNGNVVTYIAILVVAAIALISIVVYAKKKKA